MFIHEKISALQGWLLSEGYNNSAKDCNNLIKLSKSSVGLPHLGIEPNEEILASKELSEHLHYVYVLKLENKINGQDVVDKNTGEKIFNWYIGETRNPITRFIQHKIGRLYISQKGYEELSKVTHGPFDRKLVESFIRKSRNKTDYFSTEPLDRGYVGEDFWAKTQTVRSILGIDPEEEARCGAKWTIKHKPMEMVWLRSFVRLNHEDNKDFRQRIREEEVRKYHEVRDKYGADHVRGGWGVHCRVGNSDQEAPYPSGADNSFYTKDMKDETWQEPGNRDILRYIDSVEYETDEIIDATTWRDRQMRKHVEKAPLKTPVYKGEKEKVRWSLGSSRDVPEAAEKLRVSVSYLNRLIRRYSLEEEAKRLQYPQQRTGRWSNGMHSSAKEDIARAILLNDDLMAAADELDISEAALRFEIKRLNIDLDAILEKYMRHDPFIDRPRRREARGHRWQDPDSLEASGDVDGVDYRGHDSKSGDDHYDEW